MKRTGLLLLLLLLFGVGSRRSYRSSWNLSTSASSALVVGGIDLNYCDVELFALEMNQDHSVILSFLRLHPNTAFLTPLLTMRATTFFSKGFLPSVVGKMVI